MPFIGPPRTAQELADSAQTTYDGLGHPGLPGVKTDALKVDPKKYVQNGRLAEDIKNVFAKAKGSESGKPLFVLAWRMYPNAENPHWKHISEHNCACACACSSHKKKRKKPGGG